MGSERSQLSVSSILNSLLIILKFAMRFLNVISTHFALPEEPEVNIMTAVLFFFFEQEFEMSSGIFFRSGRGRTSIPLSLIITDGDTKTFFILHRFSLSIISSLRRAGFNGTGTAPSLQSVKTKITYSGEFEAIIPIGSSYLILFMNFENKLLIILRESPYVSEKL